MNSTHIKRYRPEAPRNSWRPLIAIFFALKLLTTGCSVVPMEAQDLPRSHVKSLDPKEAILAGSVTNPDPHIGQHSDVRFFFERADGTEKFFVTNAPLRVVGGRATDIGLESVAGKLFAVPVRPGEYEMTGVYMFQQMTRTASFSPKIRIRVNHGEVLYVGSLQVKNCYSVYVTPGGERRRETVVGGLVAVLDHAERDIPALQEAFPALRTSRVSTRPMRSDAVINRASEKLSRSCSYERRLPN